MQSGLCRQQLQFAVPAVVPTSQSTFAPLYFEFVKCNVKWHYLNNLNCNWYLSHYNFMHSGGSAPGRLGALWLPPLALMFLMEARRRYVRYQRLRTVHHIKEGDINSLLSWTGV